MAQRHHRPRDPDLASTGASRTPVGLVARRRLTDVFEVGQPLTLVSAQAGFGKSVLVESWVTGVGEGCTVVRMALDDDAVDPRVFLAVGGGGVCAAAGSTSRVSPWGVRINTTWRFSRGTSRHIRRRWCGCWTRVSSCCRRRWAPGWTGSCGGAGQAAAGPADPGRSAVAAGPVPAGRAITEIRADDLAFTTAEVAGLMQRGVSTWTPGTCRRCTRARAAGRPDCGSRR